VCRSAEARLRACENAGSEGVVAAELELAKYRKAFGKWEDVYLEGKENAISAKESELKIATLKGIEMESVSLSDRCLGGC
jgi:hypothetical protein